MSDIQARPGWAAPPADGKRHAATGVTTNIGEGTWRQIYIVTTNIRVGTAWTSGGYLSVINDPAATSPMLTSAKLAANAFTLNVPTQLGYSYALEYKTALSDSGWIALQTNIGTGQGVTFMDAVLLRRAAFIESRVQ